MKYGILAANDVYVAYLKGNISSYRGDKYHRATEKNIIIIKHGILNRMYDTEIPRYYHMLTLDR
jgi:hypothetical protein